MQAYALYKEILWLTSESITFRGSGSLTFRQRHMKVSKTDRLDFPQQDLMISFSSMRQIMV